MNKAIIWGMLLLGCDAPSSDVTAVQGAAGDASTSTCALPLENLPLADMPEALATAECAALIRCYGAYYVSVAFPDDSCVSTLRTRYEQGDFAIITAGVAAGTVSYHPEHVACCRAALASAACTVALAGPPECAGVIEGTIAEGGTCQVEAECAGDSACFSGDRCPGTCRPRGAEGAPCARARDCVNGLGCGLPTGPGAANTCTPLAIEGARCDGPTLCAPPLQCATDSVGNRSCAPPSALFTAQAGEPCNVEQRHLCQEGLVCAPDPSGAQSIALCRAPQTTPGGACSAAYPEDCPQGQVCMLTDADVLNGITQSTCGARSSAGQPCYNNSLNSGCAAGLRCTGTSCEVAANLGEPCDGESSCASTYCTNGVCTPSQACN